MAPRAQSRKQRLESDPDYQSLLAAVGERVNRIVQLRFGDNAAAAARAAGLSESGLDDIVRGRSDPKLSTLHSLAVAGGYRLFVFFEAGPRPGSPTDG